MFGVLRSLAAASLLFTAQAGNAGLVTLAGASVNYVYEDTQAAVALFGEPVIVGDSVVFVPRIFRAESLNGAGNHTIAAEFIFSRVYSRDQSALGGVELYELGDYQLLRGGSVGAEVALTVTDNASGNSTSADTSFSDSGVLGSLQPWDLTLGLYAQPGVAGFNSATNDISLAILNTLTATSDTLGEGAWIQKKLAFAAITGSAVNPPSEVVPAPGVLWLFGAGVLALAGLNRFGVQGKNALSSISPE